MKNEKKAKGKNENRRDAYLAGDVKGRKLKKKDSNKKEGSLVPKLFTGRQTRKEKKEKKKKSLYGWCWKKITCCGLCLPCSDLGREPSLFLQPTQVMSLCYFCEEEPAEGRRQCGRGRQSP